MKKIGTIKEVYLGDAIRTKNNMTKKDIINFKKKQSKISKKGNLSKKINANNQFNNPLIRYKTNNYSKKKNQSNEFKKQQLKKKKYINERKQERLKRRINKSARKKLNKNKKLSKKIAFNMNQNITREYHCKQLENDINGYESDDEDETPSNEFKIEEMPDIDISDYI